MILPFRCSHVASKNERTNLSYSPQLNNQLSSTKFASLLLCFRSHIQLKGHPVSWLRASMCLLLRDMSWWLQGPKTQASVTFDFL